MFSRIFRAKTTSLNFFKLSRNFAKCPKKGLALGFYDNGEFTETAKKINAESNGKLKASIPVSHTPKVGETYVTHDVLGYHAVALSCLGPQDIPFDDYEMLNVCKENIRIAACNSTKKLQRLIVDTIEVETFGNGEPAAEGSILGVFNFQDLKTEEHKALHSLILPYGEIPKEGWEVGEAKARAQNVARMMEMCPPNIMTPIHVAKCAVEKLCPLGIQVEGRDYDWMQANKMDIFLKMARGSCEPPITLELAYCGGNPDDKPILMIGKGVTFDSGGLCLNRDNENMFESKADMAGAAVIIGTFKALAMLRVPINCNAIIPLCENMPGGQAAKPGTVVKTVTGKTVRIDNTWHDGRIFLVDALTYGSLYKPCLTMTFATLGETMRLALAGATTAVFTPSDVLFKDLERAGAETADRVWRFPLWKYYSKKLTEFPDTDFSTVGLGMGGDPCTAAAFFKEFAPKGDFVHFDISGTGRSSTGTIPYLKKKIMSGRPTRTIIEFLMRMGAPKNK